MSPPPIGDGSGVAVDERQGSVDTPAATGTAVTMAERNARKALSVADRGYVLDMGENRFEGSGDELLESDDVAELYLGG
jgi:ABC-type branched-subunit amino acid transport system ATPase component